MPQPCLLVHAAVPRVCTGGGSMPSSSAGGTVSVPAAQQHQLICASEGCSPDTAAAAPAQVQQHAQQAQQQVQQPVLRRKSTTPRSVLDFLDEGARHFMQSGHAELAEDLLAALGGAHALARRGSPAVWGSHSLPGYPACRGCSGAAAPWPGCNSSRPALRHVINRVPCCSALSWCRQGWRGCWSSCQAPEAAQQRL